MYLLFGEQGAAFCLQIIEPFDVFPKSLHIFFRLPTVKSIAPVHGSGVSLELFSIFQQRAEAAPRLC
jgi:hypothetical protein